MKLPATLFLAAAAAAAAAAGPTPDELTADYSFEQFQQDFGKAYATPAEAEARRVVFELARNRAVAHNADASQPWKMAVNQFSDMTQGEFRHSHGYVSPLAARAELGAMEFAALDIPHDFDARDLPASKDWRTAGVISPVKNQGQCGSCWAFASTEQVESYVAIDTGAASPPVLSPQQLVSCDKNPQHCGGTGGCQGSIAELAYEYVKANGLALTADDPYTSGSTGQNGKCRTDLKSAGYVDGYVKLKENNYTEVMYALANVGPLAVNVDAMPWQSYGGGVFTGCTKESTDIDHVVQLVGYGTDTATKQDYWLVRNSWADTWGEDGYIRILRHDPATDAWCAQDTSPLDGTGCTGGPPSVKVCGSCGIVYDASYPTGGSTKPPTAAATK